MGFFNRLTDFGDREQIRTVAMRIDIGLQQIEAETNPHEVGGLCFAVKQDVDYMLNLASRLTMESLNCLNVRYKGQSIPYFAFLSKISDVSDMAMRKGGHPLI